MDIELEQFSQDYNNALLLGEIHYMYKTFFRFYMITRV